MYTKEVYKQWENGKNILVHEYVRLDITVTVIYYYLKRKSWNFKISCESFFLHWNNHLPLL